MFWKLMCNSYINSCCIKYGLKNTQNIHLSLEMAAAVTVTKPVAIPSSLAADAMYSWNIVGKLGDDNLQGQMLHCLLLECYILSLLASENKPKNNILFCKKK